MLLSFERQCFLFFCLFCLADSACAQDMDPQERARKSNVINSVIMNSEAMIRGDLMLYENEFYDGRFFKNVSDRETLEVSAIHRVVFDHEKGKFLHLARTTYDHLDLKKISDDSDGRSIRCKVKATLIDLGGKSYSKSDGKLYRLSSRNTEMISPAFDPRSIGLGADGFRSFEDIKKFASQLATGDSLLEMKAGNDFLELEFRVSNNPERQIDTIQSIQFCNKSNMPIKCNRYLRYPAGINEVSTTCVQWEEMSGLFIPCLIKSSSVEFFYDEQFRKTPGDMTKTTYLHWFSLNDELREGLFDLKNLNDQKRFGELIDPVKSKAVKIVEVLKKQNWPSSSEDRTRLHE